MKTLIKGGTIVNEGKCFNGSIVIEDDRIIAVTKQGDEFPGTSFDETIDASGCLVLPGVIDEHVHFREPGLTAKADIDSESRAAAAGGVTTYFDMPNTVPQTTTPEALNEKFCTARKKSHVNYSFFYGATNDNAATFGSLDIHRIPGIKLFMGSSTGNMLVDRRESLERIFKTAPLPLMAHCEDTAIINANMETAKQGYGDDPDVMLHAMIRSEEACVESTRLAVELAVKHRSRLHIAHISTAEELDLIAQYAGGSSADPLITAEVTVGHLYFTNLDHERLGALIKVNPAIKTPVDRELLRRLLSDGTIVTVATDHAPHLISEKQGGCCKAASGMPMIQFSLVTMLELTDEHVLTVEKMVELMCHNPARLFSVNGRGFLREGYKADIVVVRPGSPWTVGRDCILSKCRWSPMEGHTYRWRVERTLCNGHTVYADGKVDDQYIGEEIRFR